MRTLVATLILAFVIFPGLAGAQNRAASSGMTLVVLPFENVSKAPGIQWISESFPEVLGERMSQPWLYIVPRTDRHYAFDRAGIPQDVTLSRITLFRVVEQMDVDYAVMGQFNFDGQTFSASAQLLDMKALRLSPELKESGPLVKILEIQDALAWDLLHQLRPQWETPKSAFLADAPAVRLDAFENYIRGVLAGTRPEKVRYLKEAVRLNPAYAEAMMELGRAYYDAGDYEQAGNWFSRIPKTDERAREANFYLGISAYRLGDNDRAQAAFSFVASQLPLPEVANNLGAIALRRGRGGVADSFQQALNGDPQDPDYHFNLALALSKLTDYAGAARQLRETIRLSPTDTEARALLDTVAAATPGGASSLELPAPRIKVNYDESSFQQLALAIENATELRLAGADPHTHAAFHVKHGLELLKQGFDAEAARNFKEAAELDPSNLRAHAGLAQALEKSDPAQARTAAQAALALGDSLESCLVLARLDLDQNHPDAASREIERALALNPQDASALALKRAIEQKLAQSENRR